MLAPAQDKGFASGQIAQEWGAALAMLTNKANNEERLWQYRESRLRTANAFATA
jgi:hypothetical protein